MRLAKRQMLVLRLVAALGAAGAMAQWALQRHARRQIEELRIANRTLRVLRAENHGLRKTAAEIAQLRRDDIEFAQIRFEALAQQTKLEAAATLGPSAAISPPRPAPVALGRTKVSTDVMPRAVAQRTPSYPSALRAGRVGGSVDVALTIDRDGDVVDSWTVSATRPEFESAVGEAVKSWRFRPAMRGGQPAEATLLVLVQFDPESGRVSIPRPVEVPSPFRVTPPPPPPDWF